MLNLLNEIQTDLTLDSKPSDIHDGWDFVALIIECEKYYNFIIYDDEAMFIEEENLTFREIEDFFIFLRDGYATSSITKLIIDNIKGYLVCIDCAVINQEFLDENPEFINEEDNNGNNASRYGCPSNYFYPKSSLGTKIASKGYNKVSALQRQGQMPYREKSLLTVLERIQSKCKKYGITQIIINSAKVLYKKVSDSKHVRGKRNGKNMIMRFINRS